MKQTFAANKWVTQEDLIINKQDLVKDKLFHLIEPFQLRIEGIGYNGNRSKAGFSAACVAVLLYFRSILVLKVRESPLLL